MRGTPDFIGRGGAHGLPSVLLSPSPPPPLSGMNSLDFGTISSKVGQMENTVRGERERDRNLRAHAVRFLPRGRGAEIKVFACENIASVYEGRPVGRSGPFSSSYRVQTPF